MLGTKTVNYRRFLFDFFFTMPLYLHFSVNDVYFSLMFLINCFLLTILTFFIVYSREHRIFFLTLPLATLLYLFFAVYAAFFLFYRKICFFLSSMTSITPYVTIGKAFILSALFYFSLLMLLLVKLFLFAMAYCTCG